MSMETEATLPVQTATQDGENGANGSLGESPPEKADNGISTEDLQNLEEEDDPFAEDNDATDEKKRSARDYVHIRIQQRNGRKTLTTVQGLPDRFDQRKILKYIKKQFACNGTTVIDKDLGEVIQLQGDQRKLVKSFLSSKDGLEMDERDIKVHGF